MIKIMIKVVAFLAITIGALPAWPQGFSGGGGGVGGGTPSAYISGNWYWPLHGMISTGGSSVTANTIYCVFGGVSQTVTVKTIGANVTSGVAASNAQFAIYSYSGGTLTLIDSTASVATTGTGAVTKALGNTTDTLSPGVLYAFCLNEDHAVTFISYNPTTGGGQGALIGSSTFTNVVNSGNLIIGRSISTTFNTWNSTITYSSMSDVTTSVQPNIAFQIN